MDESTLRQCKRFFFFFFFFLCRTALEYTFFFPPIFYFDRYAKPVAAECESYSVTFNIYRKSDETPILIDPQTNSRSTYIVSPAMDGIFIKGEEYYVQTQSSSIWNCPDPATFPYKAADAKKYSFVY